LRWSFWGWIIIPANIYQLMWAPACMPTCLLFCFCGPHRKTSELIPLCHPLPLDKVQIDIRFLPKNKKSNDDDGTMTALIDCECRVTHKTGVEMEALVGASVAALTIYDMVKAVSHEVEITETRLVLKTGGKRSVGK
jgi:cyclic pyranopterin monophosphate synthase